MSFKAIQTVSIAQHSSQRIFLMKTLTNSKRKRWKTEDRLEVEPNIKKIRNSGAKQKTF